VTDLVIATRSGTVTAPDKTMFAIVRGKTVADARHPAVLIDPRNWMPFEVELKVDDPATATEGDDIAREQLAEFSDALTQLAVVMRDRGHLDPDGSLTAEELVSRVVDLIPEQTEGAPEEPIAPPAPPRKRAASKA
jgi:hypothetical protein